MIFKGTDIVRLNGQLGSFSFDSITKDDVKQLWQVLNDDNVQDDLRESALEQIAVIMRGIFLFFYQAIDITNHQKKMKWKPKQRYLYTSVSVFPIAHYSKLTLELI